MAHESRPLSVDEAQLRKMLKRRELGLASLERTIARQRARLVGLKEGGANAQFFRIYAAKRSKHNHIATLRDGDHLTLMQGEVEEVATDFFTDLLAEMGLQPSQVHMRQPKRGQVAGQAAISLHHRKLPALLLKIDVARAFDSVAWPSILSVLRQRGFGPRWIKWVLLLLRTATTRVLVNGSAGEAFRHARGLRQGDPLSPLLFVLAMDVLARMFEVTIGDGTSVLFWEDQWIGGLNAAAIAPTILAMVRPRFRRRRTVAQGLLNHAWTADIADKLSLDATVQFFHLWDTIAGVQPADATTDAFRWKWTADGCFSSRSAYRSMFQGFTALPGAANIWNA
ncbi:hypothetical protein ACQ4PT_016772 [Festuca glaucescens]